jgi:chemotaxis receptor (MCP) glutamine deamidase CheD
MRAVRLCCCLQQRFLQKNAAESTIHVSLYDATVAVGAIAHGMLQGNTDYGKTPFKRLYGQL